MTHRVQLSTKTPDGAIIVIGGDTVTEFKATLTDLLGEDNTDGLVERVKAALEKAATDQAVAMVSQPTSQPGGLGAEPVGGPAQTCRHGEMIFRSGVGKASGKPYKAHFCPSRDRADQCDPVFVR